MSAKMIYKCFFQNMSHGPLELYAMARHFTPQANSLNGATLAEARYAVERYNLVTFSPHPSNTHDYIILKELTQRRQMIDAYESAEGIALGAELPYPYDHYFLTGRAVDDLVYDAHPNHAFPYTTAIFKCFDFYWERFYGGPHGKFFDSSVGLFVLTDVKNRAYSDCDYFMAIYANGDN